MASALEWLAQQTAAPVAKPEYDAFGNMTSTGQQANLWNPDAPASTAGANPDDVLYGSIASTGQAPAFKATLQQISDAAGLQGFDWTPYAAAAAQQNLQQTNNLGYHFTSDWGQALSGIVAAAAADNPQIGQVWQASGPQLAQQWSQQGSQLQQQQQERRDSNKQNAWLMAAAPFAAGGLAALAAAPAAGAAGAGAGVADATALEAGLAAYTPSSAAGAGAGSGLAGIMNMNPYANIPELGMIANADSAATAIGAGLPSGMAAGGGAGALTLANAGAAAGGTSALQNILNGSGGTQDWLKLAGQAAPGILGMIGSNQQTKAMEGLAGQYMAMGQPYRDLALKYEQNPQEYFDSPQAQEMLRQMGQSISKDVGNPAGSPYGQTLLLQGLASQFGQNQQRLGNMGGLSAYNSAAPGASQSAINSGANQWNAAGLGINNVLNPPTPLEQLFKSYKTAAGQL